MSVFRRKSDSVMPKDTDPADAKVRGELQQVRSKFNRSRCVTVSGRLRMYIGWVGLQRSDVR
jgi:hypothetical protein